MQTRTYFRTHTHTHTHTHRYISMYMCGLQIYIYIYPFTYIAMEQGVDERQVERVRASRKDTAFVICPQALRVCACVCVCVCV